VVVFDDTDTVVGWAARSVHGPEELLVQVDPLRPDIAEAAVEWLAERTEAPRLGVHVYDGDVVLPSALRKAGFVPRPKPRVSGMFRQVEGDSAVPAGYAVRAVREDELHARVEVHRAAWKPASLPYVDGRRVDPRAESSFTDAAYEAVRGAWLYRSDLDLVAVSPDGSLAGCCIAWFDPAIGVAEIEPLGVVPAHRRAGLAVAMCEEVASRVRAAGGHQVFINTDARDEYPAPAAAYRKAGFHTVERATVWILESQEAPLGR
jgi:ribosomal protein S18 acetylase RimI-like enzyme